MSIDRFNGQIFLEHEFQADAIVLSHGVCPQAIINAGGPGLVFPDAGEITVSGGFGLPCSHVIRTTCCKWNGGKGEGVGIFVMIHLAFFKIFERQLSIEETSIVSIKVGNHQRCNCKKDRNNEG